jgi:hypothetical protein
VGGYFELSPSHPVGHLNFLDQLDTPSTTDKLHPYYNVKN